MPGEPMGDRFKLSGIQVRPAEIARATGLLCLSLAVGSVKVIIAWRAITPQWKSAMIDSPFTTLIFALNVLLIWKIWQGRNWARTTLLVIFVIGASRTLADMAFALVRESSFHISRPWAILQMVQLVISAYVLLLIYGSKGKHWFERKRTQAP
jgi:hypothetical protein